MSGNPNIHPPDELIRAFALGTLSKHEADLMEQHLSECETCGERLGGVEPDSYCRLVRRAGEAGQTEIAESTSFTGKDVLDLPTELRSHSRYEVERELGAGGMGVVYQATHRVMKRPVAIKAIRRELLATPMAVTRFRREVQTAGKLHHPNIVTAFDAEEVAGVNFLVMEYVDGLSLDRYVKSKGPLGVRFACDFASQAATGLAHAHKLGMIHRDIKPANLMLTKKGVVKILDFGLACWSDSERQGLGPAITHVGTRLGTYYYAAPEQFLSADQVDARADLYGLGATLFFLLTGEPPPPADPVPEHSARLAESLPAEVPPEVRSIVVRLLAYLPDDRFPSAESVVKALAPWRQRRPAPAPVASPVTSPSSPAPANRRILLPVAAGVVACFFLAVLGGYFSGFFSRKPIEPLVAPAAGAPPPTVLFLLPAENLWYEDYGPIREALEAANVQVKAATVTGAPSLLHRLSLPNRENRVESVNVDGSLGNFDVNLIDAVVGVGAKSPDLTSADHPSARPAWDFLRNAEKKGKFVVGICAGQHALAAAGLLHGRRIARSTAYTAGLVGAQVLADENVVVDRTLLTASAPEDARRAGEDLARLLRAKR